MNSPGGFPNHWISEYYIKDNEIIIGTFIDGTGIGDGITLNIDDLRNPLLEVYNNQRFTEYPSSNYNNVYLDMLSLREWEEEYGYE